MGIEDNISQFERATSNLEYEEAVRLDSKLKSGSSRYVKIEILDENCNINNINELDETASAVEEARRSQGEASENVFKKDVCSNVLRDRITKSLTRMFGAYLDTKRIDPETLQNADVLYKVAADFRESYEAAHDHKLIGKAVISLPRGAQWEISFLPDANHVEKVYTEEKEAAKTIQKRVRGYLSRKAFLPQSLYQKYKQVYENLHKSLAKEENVTKANAGQTPVYLPEEMPEAVFKATEQVKSKKEINENKNAAALRFKQMLEVREILRSQGSTNLIIPRARGYKEFLVEQRLPINPNPYHNMGLYASNPEMFNDAVREFTRLFSKASLGDLIMHRKTPYMEDLDYTIRFDNFPLFIEDNQGKIGLIDLEDIEIKSGKPELNVQDLKTLIIIFPLHTDIIIEEAKKLGVKSLHPSILEEAAKVRQSLDKGYTKYHNWLVKKEVKPESTREIEVTPERLADLTKVAESEIIRMNEGVNKTHTRRNRQGLPPKDFLVGEATTLAEEITPILLSFLNSAIMQKQSLAATNESDIMEMRTLILSEHVISSHIDLNVDLSSLKKTIYFNDEGETIFLVQDIVNNLLSAMVEELIRKEEVYSFNPDYDIDSGQSMLRI